MPTANDFAALNKVVYGDAPPTLVPDLALVQKDIGFSKGDLLGDYFEQAVRLALPGGFTRAKGDGTAGAFAMNGAAGGTQKKAKVYGYQLTLQDVAAYEDLAKAATEGQQAYKSASGFFWEGMQLSMRKMLEIVALYGNKGIGTVATYNSGTPNITVTAAEWAPQIWAGLEGASIDIMNGTSSSVRGTATIASVNIESRIIVLSGTVSGTTASDVIYFKGGYGKEASGIHDILSNTGSLFNIDAATYSLWKANSVTVSGAFSFQALKQGLAKSMNKGNMYKTVVYTCPESMDDLVGDVMQLRTVTKDEIKRVELGADQVVYRFGGIEATVKPHPMVKRGHAFGCAGVDMFWKRVGAADVSFGMPGRPDRVFIDLEGYAGVEGRIYSHQGIFSEMPGCSVLWTGITPTA